MSIAFNPKHGQVLVCDFRGFVPPEMVKPRPVVVINKNAIYRHELATVVPISTTPPLSEKAYCVRLGKNYRPDEPDDLPCWAKADMCLSVSWNRLNGFRMGGRKWEIPQMDRNDLSAVMEGVAHALGMRF